MYRTAAPLDSIKAETFLKRFQKKHREREREREQKKKEIASSKEYTRRAKTRGASLFLTFNGADAKPILRWPCGDTPGLHLEHRINRTEWFHAPIKLKNVNLFIITSVIGEHVNTRVDVVGARLQ